MAQVGSEFTLTFLDRQEEVSEAERTKTEDEEERVDGRGRVLMKMMSCTDSDYNEEDY